MTTDINSKEFAHEYLGDLTTIKRIEAEKLELAKAGLKALADTVEDGNSFVQSTNGETGAISLEACIHIFFVVDGRPYVANIYPSDIQPVGIKY